MIEEKTFENKVLSLGNFNEDKFFHFKISSPNSLPNYIKLLVKDKNSNNVYNNFILSYYQDESFMDRKQLSQNSSDTTIMWLSKAQIKEGFYLSIECGTKSCEYNFNIFPENIIVLNLGQTYKYYVTEENEEMTFKIKGSLNINETKLVTIYAKGKRDINSTLNDSDYMSKHLKYNAYIINATKDKEFSKELKVKGSTGDLISVGGFLCEAKEGKCHLEELNDNEEYSGFLKKNELEINCFNNTLFKDTSYKFILNDNKNSLSEETFKLGYKCVKLPNNFNEIFYSLRIYKTKSDKNKYISLIPLEIGTQHHAFHLDYEILAFIPIIEEDFNFLTYKNHSYQTDSKAYITICDTYPLCNITLDNLDNYNKLERFYDIFFISYNKSNIKNISSISKKKHVIIINCGATLEGDRTIGYFYTSIYTDKSLLEINFQSINYFFIEKGSINNFIFDMTKANNNGLISIQKISGDISTNLNYNYTYKNIYSYEFKKNDKITICKIKAEKNSIYNIKVQYFYGNNFAYNLGGNYILNLKLDFSKFEEKSLENDLTKYFKIYPIGCNIDLKYEIENLNTEKTTNTPIKINKGFYQNISSLPSLDENIFLSIENQSQKDVCMIYISLFKLEDKNSGEIISGIILDENITQSIFIL